MNTLKRRVALLLVGALLAAGLFGCAAGSEAPAAGEAATGSESAVAGAAASGSQAGVQAAEEAQDAAGESVSFTDSVGRAVEIPASPQRIAPSGAVAQMALLTLVPERLVGLATEITPAQQAYLNEALWQLPAFGQLYGQNALNLESLIAAGPDIIIDIGQAKGSIAEDCDALQEQTGIPVVFVEMTLDGMAEAYRALGGILGAEARAEELAAYAEETLGAAAEASAGLAEEERVRVYYGVGENGLGANAAGSVHADVLEAVGAVNVAETQEVQSGGGDEITLEQLLLWQPEMILFDPEGGYDAAAASEDWQLVEAVAAGRCYEVPAGPYNWLGRPPAPNRLLGVRWLGNLLYPELYGYDMVAEAQRYYELFYGAELSAEDAEALLARGSAA